MNVIDQSYSFWKTEKDCRNFGIKTSSGKTIQIQEKNRFV